MSGFVCHWRGHWCCVCQGAAVRGRQGGSSAGAGLSATRNSGRRILQGIQAPSSGRRVLCKVFRHRAEGGEYSTSYSGTELREEYYTRYSVTELRERSIMHGIQAPSWGRGVLYKVFRDRAGGGEYYWWYAVTELKEESIIDDMQGPSWRKRVLQNIYELPHPRLKTSARSWKCLIIIILCSFPPRR